MPTVSIYLSDDTVDWLSEKVGKGNVSPYIGTLIEKDSSRVKLEEDKKTFEFVLNFSLLFVGLAFILIIVGQNLFPGIGSFGYVVVLLSGGVLLIMQSLWKIQADRKVKKNGAYNPVIGG